MNDTDLRHLRAAEQIVESFPEVMGATESARNTIEEAYGLGGSTLLELLDELKRHATQDKYRLRLKYGVGDLVIWDNASLLHSATLTDTEDPRTLWRITVKEESKP